MVELLMVTLSMSAKRLMPPPVGGLSAPDMESVSLFETVLPAIETVPCETHSSSGHGEIRYQR
jgi:hypothetical protein